MRHEGTDLSLTNLNGDIADRDVESPESAYRSFDGGLYP